ncbi:2-phosphosulfolactate phosphatase [Streptomyces sp. NPDC006678]|uniref:2-phosphosulfolactate phosphatase n=1 Tax=Streptomyces sp. NPDC006678 TaxID=3157185 RepID=UPI0033E58DE1
MIAAGERWPDGSLRPALEDAYGAGAIIAELQKRGAGPLSPEAAAARSSFTGTPEVADTVADCSSGRELIQQGFADDVAIAIELDATMVVPILTDGAFTAVPGRGPVDA